jgi:hypothetical protein
MVESIRKEGPWPLTFQGKCGHTRQQGLPCANPKCGETASLTAYGYMRSIKTIEGVEHYLWVQIKR